MEMLQNEKSHLQVLYIREKLVHVGSFQFVTRKAFMVLIV